MHKQKIRVLLVEGHKVVRQGLCLMLSSADDIEVAGAVSTAADAWSRLQEIKVDVVLMNVGLPDKSGLGLLKHIRLSRPTLAVLLFSMYADEIYALRALMLGASGYLTETSSVGTVTSAIRRVASGYSYLDATLNSAGAELSPSLVDGPA